MNSFIKIAQSVRDEMIAIYGDDLQGKCIEASEKIVERILLDLGIEAITVEGWCQYDDECYGSDRPWDEHTWVEMPELGLYIDVTAEQFNHGMFSENDYAAVIVCKGLPHGMRYDEPKWEEYEQMGTERFQLFNEVLQEAINKSKVFKTCKNNNLEIIKE